MHLTRWPIASNESIGIRQTNGLHIAENCQTRIMNKHNQLLLHGAVQVPAVLKKICTTFVGPRLLITHEHVREDKGNYIIRTAANYCIMVSMTPKYAVYMYYSMARIISQCSSLCNEHLTVVL